jgi:hypothetical protein
MGQVVIDPEVAIARLDKLDKDLKELRELFTNGFTSKPIPVENHAFDLTAVKWMFKDKASGQNRPANLDDGYAWAFAATQNGVVPPERAPLVDFLKQHGKVQQNGYELTISKDGKFLGRTRLPVR